MREPHEKFEYGSEDQDSVMNLIDSRAWPAEPEKRKTTENYIEQYAKEVNELRCEIATREIYGKDAEDLKKKLEKAEEELDTWINMRIKRKAMKNEELPF